jgi:hypothetical protein
MRRFALLPLLAAGLGVGCDASQRGRDASTRQSQRAAEVSVRIDAPAGGVPSVSVLSFRAAVTGASPFDVLGVVDPLVAAAPEARCELREVAAATRALRAAGGAVELEALANVQVELAPSGTVLRPTPRVYPPLAAVVGGVIGEAMEDVTTTLPSQLTVSLGDDSRELISVPPLPRLLDRTERDANGDLLLTVQGPPRTFLEVRPFGGTMSLACPVEGERVTVPHDLLERLAAASGRVPISFEAVFRESRLVTAAAGATRVTVEARSSAVIDFRP